MNLRATICDHCRSLLADASLTNDPIRLRHVVCHAKITQLLRVAATRLDCTIDIRSVRMECEVDEGRALELAPWAEE
jgi:hypothetical protein